MASACISERECEMTSSLVPNPPPANGGAEISSQTTFKILKCSYTWTLKNFSSSWMKTGENLISPIFSCEDENDIKWCLSLYPAGNIEENKDYVSLYLRLASTYEAEIRAKYKFCVLNKEREKTYVWETTEVASFLRKTEVDTARCGRHRFALMSYLVDNAGAMLPDDSLTILCELSASTVASCTSTINDNRSMMPKIPSLLSNSNVLQADKWGCTRVNVVDFSYMWTISNFKFCNEKTGQFITSPIFSVRDDSQYKWVLLLYPNGENDSSKDYISLFLRPATANETDVKVTYTLSIINSKGEKAKKVSRTEPHTFLKEKLVGHGSQTLAKKELLSTEASELLSGGKLTLFCEISYVTDVVSIAGHNEPPPTLEIPESQPFDCLEVLLVTRKFCDVTFVVGDRELHAHKAILAVCSPIFSAMFEHEMEERRLSRVKITDIDYEVFEETLRFVYVGRVNNLSSMASALLVVAEKYDLGNLKAICEQELCSKLAIDNAADMLILADTYNAKLLKARTIDFVSAHAAELVDNDSFKLMMTTYPQLFAMISFQLLVALKIK